VSWLFRLAKHRRRRHLSLLESKLIIFYVDILLQNVALVGTKCIGYIDSMWVQISFTSFHLCFWEIETFSDGQQH